MSLSWHLLENNPCVHQVLDTGFEASCRVLDCIPRCEALCSKLHHALKNHLDLRQSPFSLIHNNTPTLSLDYSRSSVESASRGRSSWWKSRTASSTKIFCRVYVVVVFMK